MAMATALLVPATAAAQIGAPREVRVSRPSDERPRPSAYNELWELLATNPRTGATLALRLRRAPDHQLVAISVGGPGREPLGLELPQTFQRGGRALVRFSGTGGTTKLTRRGNRVGVTLDAPEASGRFSLNRTRPGAYARGWRLGPASRGEREVQTDLSLNVPVATSTLRGSVRIGGETVRLDGWRGSLEHVWGAVHLYEGPYAYWDAYTVHGRRGTAWLAFGLNRGETITGPGAMDAQWLGVLTRVTARGVRVCRPTVHRRAWTFGYRSTPFAQELRARCGGMRVRLRDVPDSLLPVGEGVGYFFQLVYRSRAGGRGAGLGRHRGFSRG